MGRIITSVIGNVNTFVRPHAGPLTCMNSLASRLLHARTLRELSQEDLAALAKVSQGTIGNIEAGIRFGKNSLADIAAALNVRYWWLRDGEGAMDTPGGWPFEIEFKRYDNLSERGKGFVESRLLSAIEEREAVELRKPGAA